MKNCPTLSKFEQASYDWMAKYGILLLRLSMGVIFFWFGFQKFFPGISSAESIATRTIEVVTFNLINEPFSMPLLATWEVLIGLGFLTGRFIRVTSLLLFLQMIGTFAPLFVFPKETFFIVPIVPTLAGQYIIKNLVFIAVGMIILTYYQGRVIRKIIN
ncbi:MAG TPA: DoxX family membrane protein [Bacteroidales bacterium]|nr:DoxX family membrane protein [Bacteroidales bacterium]